MTRKFISKFITLLFALAVATFRLSASEFKPPVASVFEESVGAHYQFETEKLRLDIGNSFDLFALSVADNKMTIGADFFTYTRLRTAGNFKFPVETSDYYFGLNSAYFDTLGTMPMAYRLRVAHVSSHLVDGLADSLTFKRLPFVYSREFADFMAMATLGDFRVYAGVNFLYSTKPKDFSLFHPQLGFDFEHKLSNSISIKGGYDFKLVGIADKYHGVSNYNAGIAFNTPYSTQIYIAFYGYNGKSMHGMYFNERDDYTGIGFNFLF